LTSNSNLNACDRRISLDEKIRQGRIDQNECQPCDISALIRNRLLYLTEGHVFFLEAGLEETGWNRFLEIKFIRLRDCGLADNSLDREVWRFVQEHRLLLITNNRNNDGETSLQTTITRENTPGSLPVITVSNKESLRFTDYRQRAIDALVNIILYPEDFRGAGRVFIP
jgi:hypothetical protein